MNSLPHLARIFERLKRGYHLGPDDEPEFSALAARFDEYSAQFDALGLKLVRHEREFFYFEPDNAETVPDTLPRIAVFSYILIDHAANQGRPIEEFIFSQNFMLSTLPHFTLDRYTALLRQVDVHEVKDVEYLLRHMERIGWVRCEDNGEFRFLRPFHRVFSKCLELSQAGSSRGNEAQTSEAGQSLLTSAATTE
jgi:hypothetical protein